ncbi:MAG: Rieske 2Fe-2S domain-containing protein [Bdellovibrionales bacterium]|nr:Rieske 2Fe-2S domain-containing protein [Bdellovibrionales bacterium]
MSLPSLEIDPDISKSFTLPGSFYTFSERYEQVKKLVFERSWQLACHADELKVPGQVVPFAFLENIVPEPLLMTRDHDDQLRCISNVCTHRGNLVVEDAGIVKNLRCRYHGRKFKLDGSFQSMPECETAKNFPCEADNLAQVELENLGPFQFVALDPLCSFETWMQPVFDRIGFLPLSEFKYDESRSRDYLVQAHWALYCDNYLEGFHIPYIHADLNAAISYEDYRTELFPFCNLQVAIAKGGEHTFDLPQSSPDYGQEIAAYYFWMFPNLMLNFYPWGLSVNIVKPLGIDRTKVSFRSYVWQADKLEQGAGAALDRVEREDEAVVELVQKGVSSRLYSRGRFSPTREQGTHHFHRLLAELLNQK